MTNRNLNRMKSKGTNKKVEVNDGKRKQRKIEYDTADGGGLLAISSNV